jgi:hypothetical protein
LSLPECGGTTAELAAVKTRAKKFFCVLRAAPPPFFLLQQRLRVQSLTAPPLVVETL